MKRQLDRYLVAKRNLPKRVGRSRYLPSEAPISTIDLAKRRKWLVGLIHPQGARHRYEIPVRSHAITGFGDCFPVTRVQEQAAHFQQRAIPALTKSDDGTTGPALAGPSLSRVCRVGSLGVRVGEALPLANEPHLNCEHVPPFLRPEKDVVLQLAREDKSRIASGIINPEGWTVAFNHRDPPLNLGSARWFPYIAIGIVIVRALLASLAGNCTRAIIQDQPNGRILIHPISAA